MSKNIKSDHLKMVKDLNQNVKDLIIQAFTKLGFEIGEGSFAGNMILTNAGVSPVGSTSVTVPQNLKEFVHALMTVNVSKQFQQEKRRRIIT